MRPASASSSPSATDRSATTSGTMPDRAQRRRGAGADRGHVDAGQRAGVAADPLEQQRAARSGLVTQTRS